MMITVSICPALYSFSCTGHAGYAPHGEDIVCAAASALACGLVAALTENESCFETEPAITAEHGNVQISCTPRAESAEKVRTIFESYASGLTALGAEYPDHITVKVVG